jgi:hypothetical protein
LASLNQIGQQQSILGSQRGRIEHTVLDVCPRTPDGEAGCTQVSYAAVWLKRVVLKGRESQFFCSADET